MIKLDDLNSAESTKSSDETEFSKLRSTANVMHLFRDKFLKARQTDQNSKKAAVISLLCRKLRIRKNEQKPDCLGQ